MRRFELAETPRRFWEIGQRDTEVSLRWGSEGRTPQSHDRGFATAREAAAYVDQQIAAQLGKGYVEVGPSREEPEVPLQTARSIRFERGFADADQARTSWRRHPEPRQYLEVLQEGRRIALVSGHVTAAGDEPERGSRQVKQHGSIRDANAAFAEAIADARYQGWREVHGPATASHREHPELEARCLEAPDDPAPWSIYADWLQAHGDPRGEIAALQLAGRRAEARRVLGAHLAELTGSDAESFVFEYRHGFARRATIRLGPADFDDPERCDLAALTQTLLTSPMARFLDALRFGLAGFSSDNDWAPSLRAVIDSPRAPHLRELAFDAFSYEDSELSWVSYGDFTGLLERLPALEHVHIRSGAGGTLGGLQLPRLRTLIRESGGLAATEIEAIVRARWPNLEHLEIWFGAANYGAEGTIDMLGPIFAARELPRLVHLGLVNAELVEDAIDALAHSRVLPQLHSLDLSRGILARRGAALLCRHAAAFRHLASLDLSQNLLAPEDVARIRDTLDNVIVCDQRERDDDYEEAEADGEMVRYVAVGE
jgi:uncharacterized protein (TIGR02996 family)